MQLYGLLGVTKIPSPLIVGKINIQPFRYIGFLVHNWEISCFVFIKLFNRKKILFALLGLLVMVALKCTYRPSITLT